MINDTINGTGPKTDFQVMDIIKCFDKMDFRETINDLYDNNMKNDNLAVLAETSKITRVAIKSPVGMTDTREKEEIITQGLGKECINQDKGLFKYKECVDCLSPRYG